MELFNVHPNSSHALSTKNKDARQQTKLVINKTGRRTLPSGFTGVSEYYVPPGHHACFYHNSGNKMHFCTTGPDGKNLYDLDKSWLYDHPIEEYNLMKNCDDPINMWDDECMVSDKDTIRGDICADRKSKCHNNRLLYCNKLQEKDKIDKRCISFCLKNKGECDDLMKRYCSLSENINAPECSCLNSASLSYNPVCIDAKCFRDGYTTKDMEKPCEKDLSCDIYGKIKDKDANHDFIDRDIHQRCSLKALKAAQVGGEGTNLNNVDILSFSIKILLIIIISVVLYMFAPKLVGFFDFFLKQNRHVILR